MHKIIVIGNVGQDPQIKSFENGGKVANFSVADTERAFKTKEGKEIPEHTEWFRCVARAGIADTIEKYVKKGNKVGITGKLKTREYEDKGEKKSVTELIVESLELLTPKGSTESIPQSSQTTQQSAQPQQEKDDLPF